MLKTIQLAEFSKYPGGRFRTDGPGNGEQFRDDFLVPELEKADNKVIVVLDGVEGLPPSFLEEVFGGLVRRGFSLQDLKDRLEIVARTRRMARYPQIAWGHISSAGNAL